MLNKISNLNIMLNRKFYILFFVKTFVYSMFINAVSETNSYYNSTWSSGWPLIIPIALYAEISVIPWII